MRSLILLRGLPGSGKSTLAEVLSEKNKYPVLSVDDYFTDAVTNEYNFKHTENYLAYKHCEEQTKANMLKDCEKIFVHNTFTLDWEMEPYFKLASEYQYSIFVVTVENYHGGQNIHDVSKDQILKMAEKYKVKLY